MKDLIQEYFTRDLTESEAKELGVRLSSSPEDAERFAGFMEKHYQMLGLPNPVWKPKPFHQPGLKLGLEGLKQAVQTLHWTGSLKLTALVLSLSTLSYVSYRAYSDYTESRPSLTVPASVPVNPAPLKPRYQELSVSVELPQSGLVTVRVYDAHSVETKILYAGVLPAGKNTFKWDGKKEDGTLAAPGKYFILVKSGKNQLRREVHIEAD